jgi:hypothetical protein
MSRYLGPILVICVCSSSFAVDRMARDWSSATSSITLRRVPDHHLPKMRRRMQPGEMQRIQF